MQRLIILLLLVLAWPARAQQAGSLVSADPVRDTPAGQQAWQIAYWTADEHGRARQVTGMVIAPREAIPRQPRRVIAWAHGTWGVAERCAPSQSEKFFTATPALGEMIARGYTVVAPDYPGLGSGGPHPFLAGVATARSVLDGVRAARQIPGAASGTSFAVWGESQGGHAALWTAALAGSYAPDLRLVGTAAAAPPTDLPANFRLGSDANARALLTAFTAWSWSQVYGAPLGTVFSRPAQGVVNRLARNNCIELGKTPRIGTVLGVAAMKNALKTKNLGTILPWSGLLGRNSIAPVQVIGPLLIAQTRDDPIVAESVTRAFAKGFCRNRGALRYVAMAGGDHGNSARDGAAPTLDWIGARFAGQAPPNDCLTL